MKKINQTMMNEQANYAEFPKVLVNEPDRFGILGMPMVMDGIPSIFRPSRSFIITLSLANLSLTPDPGPNSVGRSSATLNPFSNCPQSLRRARYGLSKDASMRPR